MWLEKIKIIGYLDFYIIGNWEVLIKNLINRKVFVISNMSLINKKCVPCENGEGILNKSQIIKLLKEIQDWKLTEDEKKIEKAFKFSNFKEALDFVNKVGKIAEGENHHPDILLFAWNKVKISLSTHSVKSLTENDFILAAKIDVIS